MEQILPPTLNLCPESESLFLSLYEDGKEIAEKQKFSEYESTWQEDNILALTWDSPDELLALQLLPFVRRTIIAKKRDAFLGCFSSEEELRTYLQTKKVSEHLFSELVSWYRAATAQPRQVAVA